MTSYWAALLFIGSHFLDDEYFEGSKHSDFSDPFTPLQKAAMQGNVADVETILRYRRLEKDWDPDGIDGEGMTPLHWASLRGHVQVIRKLLEFGANVQFIDYSEDTALHHSALSGNPSAVRELLLWGSSADAQNLDGDTALHFAVKEGDFDVVEMLLSHGALANITNNRGKNVLDLADEGGRVPIIKLLKSVGATVAEASELEEGLFGRNETYSRELYRWEDNVEGDQIPKDAVVGGTDLQCERIFVGRVKHGQHILPAKVCPKKKFAHYSYDDNEFYSSKYQLLCSDNVIWKPVRHGEVPTEAFAAGRDAGGEKLYVGRTFLEFEKQQFLTPGKVVPSENMLYTSFHYQVYKTNVFELLIIQ